MDAGRRKDDHPHRRADAAQRQGERADQPAAGFLPARCIGAAYAGAAGGFALCGCGDEEGDEDARPRKLTLQEKAVYLEGDALQIEMGNIVMRTGVGGNVLYDVARASQHKDRYSALAMAVRYIAELEDERKRRLTRPQDVAVGVVSRF